MSYSNGLFGSTSTQIIEGKPGVGFKLTTDGNYDMKNKKLTNLKPGQNDHDNNLNLNNNKMINVKNATDNSDAVNLQQLNEVNSVIATNISKSYFKKDGSNLDSNLSINNNNKLLIWQHLLIKMIVQINHTSIKMKVISAHMKTEKI